MLNALLVAYISISCVIADCQQQHVITSDLIAKYLGYIECRMPISDVDFGC